MENFQRNMGLLALLVILSFTSVGFAIGQKLFWLAGLLFVLGFALMGIGLSIKRKQQSSEAR